MDSIQEICERMAARARAEAKEQEQEDSQAAESSPAENNQQLAQVIQLPIWPEHQRATPNVVARSALFSAVSDKTKRPLFREETLASWGDCSLQYSGELLTQNDADVWYQLLDLHRMQGVQPGGRVHFTTSSFLRALRKKYGSGNSKALMTSINRLYVASLNARLGSAVIANGERLVKKYARDERTGRWTVELEPMAVKLFDHGYTRFDWDTRLQLRASTARWLQTYVQSHRATKKHPHRIGLDQLKALMRQTCSEKRYRRQVREAMTELQEKGIVKRWSFTANGALEFTRPRGGI